MKRIRSLVAILLALLWAPVTAHCKLETLPGLEFLSCCQHEETAPDRDDDCETDGCAVVETGCYKVDDDKPVVSPLLLLVIDFLPPVFLESPNAMPVRRSRLAAVPLELPVTWQFSYRAAASPRAPSLAS